MSIPTKRTLRSSGLAVAGGLLLTALVSAACSWQVPADPGVNARLRGSTVLEGAAAPAADEAAPVSEQAAAAARDPEARRLYLDHCALCHEPIPPSSLAAGDWPRFVRKYGPRAGLFGEDRARVLRWLQANAR